MNLSSKKNRTNTSNALQPKKGYLQQAKPPTYAQLTSFVHQGTDSSYACDICNSAHPLKENCKSKPPFPPSAYFPRCVICCGYHPLGHCYFEKLRHTLFTPSMCDYCSITHIGFCNSALLCPYCNTLHNFIDSCKKQISVDLSNNLCPRCECYHLLHCPEGLSKIQSDVTLWCNKCKIEHKFMSCVPFCNRCLRRHQEGPCPASWTLCRLCDYCHQGESCPKLSDHYKNRSENFRSSDIETCAQDLTVSLPDRSLVSPLQSLDHYLELE